MHFTPTPSERAIELWEHDRPVARLIAAEGGITILIAAEYQPEPAASGRDAQEIHIEFRAREPKI